MNFFNDAASKKPENFFENELRKIVSPITRRATYVGRVCYVDLGENVRAKIRFATHYVANRYVRLNMTIINARTGVVDAVLIPFGDILEKGALKTAPYVETEPKPAWHVRQLTDEDYANLTRTVRDYLNIFATTEGDVLPSERED